MSFESIVVSPEQLKKEIKKHTSARMEKDYQRSVNELDKLFKKTTLFFASQQLEEYKKKMIDELKTEYIRIESESKNKLLVEERIKSQIENLGSELKDILSKNKEFNISNGHSFTSKNIHTIYNSLHILTIIIMNDKREHFVTITFKSKVPNGLFDPDSFDLEFNKEDIKGLIDIIKSNKSYFKEILQEIDLENLGKMILHHYYFASKNQHQNFSDTFKNHFQNKNFSNAKYFYNELIEFKEKMFLTHDIQLNFD